MRPLTRRPKTLVEIPHADRPLCKCHGETMMRNSYQRSGRQKWACRRRRLASSRKRYWELGLKERMKEQYEERRAREVCVRCEGPLTSEVLCWNCLSELEERRCLYR